MRPVLVTLHVGAREIGVHTYGLAIAAGLAAGIALGVREARRRGLDVGRVLDFAFWGTVVGLVGSRVTYAFGKASGPWGVAFPSGSVAFDELGSLGLLAPGAAFTPPLHPTQLYEAGGEL